MSLFFKLISLSYKLTNLWISMRKLVCSAKTIKQNPVEHFSHKENYWGNFLTLGQPGDQRTSALYILLVFFAHQQTYVSLEKNVKKGGKTWKKCEKREERGKIKRGRSKYWRFAGGENIISGQPRRLWFFRQEGKNIIFLGKGGIWFLKGYIYRNRAPWNIPRP